MTLNVDGAEAPAKVSTGDGTAKVAVTADDPGGA